MPGTLLVAFFAVLATAGVASAQDIKVRCPSEGLFDAAREIGDRPNPAAGWQLFLEGKPRKIELQPPTGPQGTWLITCHVDVGGALVPINAYMNGTRACRFSGGNLTSLPNGGQSCSVDAANDSCLITCH
jgi:surface antigen